MDDAPMPSLRDNRAVSGIQYVTDEKGRKVGVLIDLKKHGAIWEDFWDGLVSESFTCIDGKIVALAENPRPAGCKKLKGHKTTGASGT